jgi:hypothetical protein
MDRFFNDFYPDSRMHDPLTLSTLFLPTVKFVDSKMTMGSLGEFVQTLSGQTIKTSFSVNYDLFWSDVFKKLL